MNWCRREPTLKEMLSDSIVRTMMDADGVDSHELEAMLKKVGGRVSPPAERVCGEPGRWISAHSLEISRADAATIAPDTNSPHGRR
jgi:hypothetical protein